MSETKAVNATEKKSNRFDLLLRAASAALLVVASIICAGLTVYYGNAAEFSFNNYALYLSMSILGFLLFLFLFLLQFPFKRTLYFCVVNYLVFCAGICLYFQSNWFLWDLGPLMAGEFWWDWAEQGKNTILESGFYIALIALFIWGRKWLYNNLVKLSFVIIAVEIIALSPLLLKPKEDFSYMHYSIDKTKKFEFAKDKNIIICVFDCFSTPLMEELFNQSPEIKDVFSDFTMYTKLIAKRPLTRYAVPAIMTGENLTGEKGYEQLDNKTLSSLYFNEKKSILLKLSNIGFKTEVYPCDVWADSQIAFYFDKKLMSNLIPHEDNSPAHAINPQNIQKYIYAICLRISPLRLKGAISRKCCALYKRFFTVSSNESVSEKTELPDNAKFYHELKEQACKGSEPCMFKYYHLKGVHYLFDTDENLEPLPNVSSRSASLTRENYLKMAKGCIKIMKELISQLKNLGIYDNSVIIFMGDHGRMEEIMGIKCEITGEHNPLLLVKMFHENHSQMNVNANILLQTDICQIPLWSAPDSAASDYLWGSEFNSQQKDERLSIWKSYQNKESDLFFKQSGKFELEKKAIDFSRKVILHIENPTVEGSNLCGLIWFRLGLTDNSAILLANSKNVYSVPLTSTQEVVAYSCDVSNVEDGEYEMYYMMDFKTGQKLIQFPHCKILVQNKKPVVVNLEKE